MSSTTRLLLLGRGKDLDRDTYPFRRRIWNLPVLEVVDVDKIKDSLETGLQLKKLKGLESGLDLLSIADPRKKTVDFEIGGFEPVGWVPAEE